MIRNQRIERLFVTVLVLIMLCGIFPNTRAHAVSSSDVILDIPWNYINKCGHQAVSGPCQAYCWSYCRIILDKAPHTYRDYYVNGVGGVGPSAAGYNDGKTANSVSDLLQNVYDNINQGRPVMLRVVGSYSYHYVVAVGYRANSNRNNLKTSDILILNPANKAISSSAGSNPTYTYLDSCTISGNRYWTPKSGGTTTTTATGTISNSSNAVVGKTSKPSVSVNGQTVTASWTYSGSATKFDVYLVQDPWRWADIKYQATVTGNSCAFNNVSPGEYCAFVIARPNTDFVQSEWSDTFSVSTASSTPASSSAKPILQNGIYSLTPKCANGMCLDVRGGESGDEVNVQIYQSNSTPAQQWQFTYLNNGYYEIVSQCSGKALDVAHGWTESGTNVWQYNRNGSDAQQWQLQDASNGYYYLVPRLNTNLCLDVDNAGQVNETNVQVWTKNGTDAQKWKISSVSNTPTNANNTSNQSVLPTNFTVSTNENSYRLGESVIITLSADNATQYAISIWRGAFNTGEKMYEKYGFSREITFTPSQDGTYTIRADAINGNEYISTEKTFLVAKPVSDGPPTNLTVTTDKEFEYKLGETVTISASADNPTFFTMVVWKGRPWEGEWQCENSSFYGQTTYTPSEPGIYTLVIKAYNGSGYSVSTEKRIFVYKPAD